MTKKKTIVCLVLDETGSMQPHKEVTISGYNEYVDTLRSEEKMSMMLVRFNTEKIDVGELEPISKAAKLDSENYKPVAATPLYDAIAVAMDKTELLAGKKTPVLFIIMTDGEENSSVKHTRQEIFDRISGKKESPWTFVFLGANQDAYQVGMEIGITSNTRGYDQKDTKEVYANLATQTKTYSSRGSSVTANFWEESTTNG